jgi:hypothetical protein
MVENLIPCFMYRNSSFSNSGSIRSFIANGKAKDISRTSLNLAFFGLVSSLLTKIRFMVSRIQRIFPRRIVRNRNRKNW